MEISSLQLFLIFVDLQAYSVYFPPSTLKQFLICQQHEPCKYSRIDHSVPQLDWAALANLNFFECMRPQALSHTGPPPLNVLVYKITDI